MSANISKYFIERWEKIRQRERLNYTFSNGIFFNIFILLFNDFGLLNKGSIYVLNLFNRLVPKHLFLVFLLIIALYFLFCWVLEKTYLKSTTASEKGSYNEWKIKQLNKSCHEIEKQNKTEDQIRSEIAFLIDDLDLGKFKDSLTNELQL